jgi:hypothetical protein
MSMLSRRDLIVENPNSDNSLNTLNTLMAVKGNTAGEHYQEHSWRKINLHSGEKPTMEFQVFQVGLTSRGESLVVSALRLQKY